MFSLLPAHKRGTISRTEGTTNNPPYPRDTAHICAYGARKRHESPLSQQHCRRFLFKYGKARAFLHAPCAHPAVPQHAAAQAQHHRRTPLDAFARKRGTIAQRYLPICLFNCTLILTGLRAAVNKYEQCRRKILFIVWASSRAPPSSPRHAPAPPSCPFGSLRARRCARSRRGPRRPHHRR